MDDDLTQLKILWELAEGYGRNLTANLNLSREFSLLAAAGVLALPFGFWITELLWCVQLISGVKIAQQSVLASEPDQIAEA
jgi:hypothetical protein